MSEVVRVFMNRDEMSRDEAVAHRDEIANDIMEAIESGASYSEVEDILMDECLEMDYLFDFI